MGDTDRPRRAAGVQIELLAGEAILYHPTSLNVTHLNRTAALIWQLCDGERTVAELRDLLSSAYPESADQIRTDLDQVLTLLQGSGALEIDGEAPVDAAG